MQGPLRKHIVCLQKRSTEAEERLKDAEERLNESEGGLKEAVHKVIYQVILSRGCFVIKCNV